MSIVGPLHIGEDCLALDATEIWEIYNFTKDANPIHVHEVQFQILDRQPFLPGRTSFRDNRKHNRADA